MPRMRLGPLRVTELPLLPGAPRPRVPLPVLDERLRGTKFVSLDIRSILNPPAQTGMDFWSINPYVGCEFGCSYCYARYAHRYVVERAHAQGKLSDAEFVEFRGPNGWEAFERRVFVKEQLLPALEDGLRRYFRTGFPPATREPEAIVIGTATDPYQPAERRFRLTRRILERLARCEGLSIGIITKSPVVARDRDVLERVQRRNDLEVYVSLTTVDPLLIRRLEARSPLPAARLRALRLLTAAGINAGLIVAPVLPGITDGLESLRALFAAAKENGARFLHAGPLRLYPGIRDRFMPVLRDAFPALAPKYERAYAGRGVAPRPYARALARRIGRLQREFGFTVNRSMVDRYHSRLPAVQGSLSL